MMPTVLAAGDRFVRSARMVDDIRELVPEADLRQLELEWPDVPFGAVAEVAEASGSEDLMIAELQGVGACVTQMAPLTRRVLEACPDLELFAVGRGGPVNVNLDAARTHGVTVTFAPGRNAVSTAEHTVALLLAALRRIPEVDASLRRGEWASSLYSYDAAGEELSGSTVGLVGAGAIGARVATILLGFGAHVLVHDPYADVTSLPDQVEMVDLDALFERSRIVSLHARTSAETTGLVDAGRIAAMPAGGVLVNCARGALMDYGAVADALISGRLRAAAFDVFDVEPLPHDHPLRAAPNVVMTPHLAGASRQVAHRASRMAALEVERWATGQPPLHPA